ncbi:MAG: restriction endonuclease subunit S [Thiolinea sp.]
MSEWLFTHLENLADISSGGTPSRDESAFWGGEIAWVTPTDITQCKTNYLFHTQSYITKKGLTASSAKLLPVGTLLLTSRATIGEVKIAAQPLTTNQGFKSLIPRKIFGDFLFYQVIRLRNEFLRYAAGSTFLEINRKDTGRILIPHPSDSVEQQKIAKILKTIDRAIESTQALIEKYQLIKAGLMHDLFTRGIGADGKLRPPREAAPELYQETAIGWIPKEWELPKIGEIFSLQLGKMLSQVAKTGKAELPYLGNKNVQWNEFDFTTLETMSFSEPEKEKFKLIYGDLLVCEGGDVGRSAIWKDELSECYYQKAIHRLRPINKKVLPSFALRFMHYAKSTGILLNFTSQTSIAHLTREKLAEVPIFLPSLLEQEILTKKFDLVDVRISTEIKLLEKLRKQKAGLMHDLLTGKVKVKVDDDESDN